MRVKKVITVEWTGVFVFVKISLNIAEKSDYKSQVEIAIIVDCVRDTIA